MRRRRCRPRGSPRSCARSFPDGVRQMAVGDGTLGAALAGHPGVDVGVHVGSAQTGRSVAAACAARGAEAVLALGDVTP
ncbi:MAG TPA: aldehyde dehydrogenase family protein [Acidimicrobiales bacterium]|nr:aldehyde dehydrogenase family protein [Acidimicrobiales bacterium]